MPLDLTVSYWPYTGGLAIGSLWGNTTNLLLPSFDPAVSGVTVTTDEGTLYVGEQFTMDGRTVEFLGSGTATPGVDVLGVIVATGLSADLIMFQDVDTGEYLFTFPDGEPDFSSAIAMVVDVDAVAYAAVGQGADPICFCKRTRIATPDGPVRIEKIVAGDIVTTADGGTARVVWAGMKLHEQLPKDQRPIAIRPQSRFAPDHALRVSPQHRVQIGVADDGRPLLAPAKALLREKGVKQITRDEEVAYYHILLDRHAVVMAEGMAAESLLLADQSLQSLGAEARREIAMATGCGINDMTRQPQSRPAGHLLSVREARAYLKGKPIKGALTPALAKKAA